MDQCTRLSFGGQVHISDTISNRSSIFGVWKDGKVYMSNWQVSSDLDLIFMVLLSSLQLLLQKARHRDSDPAAAALANFLKALHLRRWKTWMLHTLYIDSSC